VKKKVLGTGTIMIGIAENAAKKEPTVAMRFGSFALTVAIRTLRLRK
jgi:hypothetical protein